MVLWIEKNKRFFIGYLAMITTTILWTIYYLISLQRSKPIISELINEGTTDRAKEIFTRLVVEDFLFNIMVGISLFYSALFVLKVLFSFIKFKFRKVEEI